MPREENQPEQENAAREVPVERNRRWREENRAALEAYVREVEREGLPLARFRSF